MLFILLGCQWALVKLFNVLGLASNKEILEREEKKFTHSSCKMKLSENRSHAVMRGTILPVETFNSSWQCDTANAVNEQMVEPMYTDGYQSGFFNHIGSDVVDLTGDTFDIKEEYVIDLTDTDVTDVIDLTVAEACKSSSNDEIMAVDTTTEKVKDLTVTNSGMEYDKDSLDDPDAAMSSKMLEPEIDVTTIHGYHAMPFLSDPSAVEFIRNSHTMFIMRGLPGSGKSTLVRCLQQTYPRAVICSADHYFLDREGNYNYDKSKISDAHKYCQNKATKHCERGTRVIIIDNTNIQRWSMSHYFRLAQNFHFYHCIIVEPQTPWRYDVEELTARNSHGVEKVFIEQKLQSLRDNHCVPAYYGWFLNQSDSRRLAEKAHEVMKTCAQELKGSFSDVKTPLQEICSSYDTEYTTPKQMLHCTANYLARRRKDPYHSCPNVLHSIGRDFTITVSGFVYSKQAICARVDLYSKCSDKGGNTGAAFNRRTLSDFGNISTSVTENVLVEEKLNLYVKEEEEKLRDKYEGVMRGEGYTDRQGLFQHGCSAHITIAYAQHGEAKQSGTDVLNICEQEFYGKVWEKGTSKGVMKGYGGDIYQVVLNQPITFDCLFHGFYQGGR